MNVKISFAAVQKTAGPLLDYIRLRVTTDTDKVVDRRGADRVTKGDMQKPTSSNTKTVDTLTLTRALVERIDKEGMLSVPVTLRIQPQILIPLARMAADTGDSIGEIVSSFLAGAEDNPGIIEKLRQYEDETPEVPNAEHN